MTLTSDSPASVVAARSLALALGRGGYQFELGVAFHYVTKDGSDSNDGRLVSDGGTGPWATIQKAANSLQPGQQVYVREGVWSENNGVNEVDLSVNGVVPQNSGVSGSPIRFIGYPGDTVIIDGQGAHAGFTLYGREYIHVWNFEIRNCTIGGIHTKSGSGRDNRGNSFRYNDIHDIDGPTGGNVGGIRADDSFDTHISENKISTVRVGGLLNGNGSGIHAYRMWDMVIEQNTISDVSAAIYSKYPDLSGRACGTWKKNYIFNCSQAFKFENTALGLAAAHNDLEISQNLVVNTLFILDNTSSGDSSGFDIRVFNNTLVNSSPGYIRTLTGFEFYNNIIYGSPVFGTQYQDGQALEPSIEYCDYNLWFELGDSFLITLQRYNTLATSYGSLSSWQAAGFGGTPNTLDVSAPGPDVNSLSSDPLFANDGDGNYRLLAGSPAVMAGRGGKTMGAYVANSETIGATW